MFRFVPIGLLFFGALFVADAAVLNKPGFVFLGIACFALAVAIYYYGKSRR
jgi:hypothetical protein